MIRPIVYPQHFPVIHGTNNLKTMKSLAILRHLISMIQWLRTSSTSILVDCTQKVSLTLKLLPITGVTQKSTLTSKQLFTLQTLPISIAVLRVPCVKKPLKVAQQDTDMKKARILKVQFMANQLVKKRFSTTMPIGLDILAIRVQTDTVRLGPMKHLQSLMLI